MLRTSYISINLIKIRWLVMVFNATFNNISVISLLKLDVCFIFFSTAIHQRNIGLYVSAYTNI